MKKYIGAIIGILVIVVLVVGLRKSPSDNQGPGVITLGAVLSFTGTAAHDGESIRKGIDLAVRDLEKEGTIVEVIYEDDQTDPKHTVSAIQKLVATHDINAMIGPTWSFLASAAEGVLSQNNIVAVQPANTSEFVERGDAHMFFGSVQNAHKEELLTEFIRDLGFQRVAIVIDQGGWGLSHLGPFRNATEKNGAEVVLEELIPFGSEEEAMPTVLAKVRDAEADLILWTGFDVGASVMMKKYHDLEMDIPIVAQPTFVAGDRYRAAQSIDAGVYIIDTVMNPKFSEYFADYYGYAPGNYVDRAYDGTMLLVEAIQNTDGSSDQIADYLTNTTRYQGFAGEYRFNENGDIEGGEWFIRKVE